MKLAGYVLRDLLRNPRRTLASVVGVIVGVGLFSGVLFFIDGSGASMTKRAIAAVTLDMQRVLTTPIGGGIRFQQELADAALDAGRTTTLTLTVANDGVAPAHEVVVRDSPVAPLSYVPGSTEVDGTSIEDVDGTIPLFQGYAGIGLNIGTVAPGATRHITYQVVATRSVPSTSDLPVQATISSREALTPTRASGPEPTTLTTLAARIARVPGVGYADPLVSVDMPTDRSPGKAPGSPARSNCSCSTRPTWRTTRASRSCPVASEPVGRSSVQRPPAHWGRRKAIPLRSRFPARRRPFP